MQSLQFTRTRRSPNQSPSQESPQISKASVSEYTARAVHSDWASPTPISFSQHFLSSLGTHSVCDGAPGGHSQPPGGSLGICSLVLSLPGA